MKKFSLSKTRRGFFYANSGDSMPKRNREKDFTNDLIYDTFCGMIGAKSNRCDAGQDFSSAEYKFTRETLTTMLGQHKLTEDKE